MLAPVGVHEVDLGAAEERDRPPVGRPGRIPAVARKPLLPASVGVHCVDAVVTQAFEGDLPPVGRPGRRLGRRAVEQRPLPAPVRVHDVEIEVAFGMWIAAPAQKGDLPPIGRPDRSTNLGPPGCALDQSEEATADSHRRSDENSADQDRSSDSGEHPPPLGSHWTRPLAGSNLTNQQLARRGDGIFTRRRDSGTKAAKEVVHLIHANQLLRSQEEKRPSQSSARAAPSGAHGEATSAPSRPGYRAHTRPPRS